MWLTGDIALSACYTAEAALCIKCYSYVLSFNVSSHCAHFQTRTLRHEKAKTAVWCDTVGSQIHGTVSPCLARHCVLVAYVNSRSDSVPSSCETVDPKWKFGDVT